MRPASLTPLMRTASRPQHKGTSIICQSRQFGLPSFSPFTQNPTDPKPRNLSATRILPFPPTPLFQTISSIESYGDFLPFLTASKVTARDPVTGYPTRAYLTIGYGPLCETFESKVECDEKNWSVGARSGDAVLQPEGTSKGTSVFDHLDTIWKLEPLKKGTNGSERTKVDLTVRFQIKSSYLALVMASVEDQVAGLMIEAFERRMLEGGSKR